MDEGFLDNKSFDTCNWQRYIFVPLFSLLVLIGLIIGADDIRRNMSEVCI